MPGKPRASLMAIWRSRSCRVGCLKYIDPKHALTATTNRFMHSEAVDSPNLQYSSQASAGNPYPSVRIVAVHFLQRAQSQSPRCITPLHKPRIKCRNCIHNAQKELSSHSKPSPELHWAIRGILKKSSLETNSSGKFLCHEIGIFYPSYFHQT